MVNGLREFGPVKAAYCGEDRSRQIQKTQVGLPMQQNLETSLTLLPRVWPTWSGVVRLHTESVSVFG